MKRTYHRPYSVVVEMQEECMIAASISKNKDFADDQFKELGNKRNSGSDIWGDNGLY